MTDLPEQVQSDLARVREAYRVYLTQDIVDAIDRLTAAFTTQQAEIERLKVAFDLNAPKRIATLAVRLVAAEKVAEAANASEIPISWNLANALADWERVKGES